MIETDVATMLLTLKDSALAATQRGDAEFYRNYLSEEAIAIVPIGVIGKEQIIRAMSDNKGAFKSKRIEDTKAIVLSPESGVVTYKATFERPGTPSEEFSMLVTTVYSKIAGDWKGVLYQQTPLSKGST
jgi:ketosteroid isomerase-like protein